jgi:thiosulfate/3-mercaptopyruvate sulfurtransferase
MTPKSTSSSSTLYSTTTTSNNLWSVEKCLEEYKKQRHDDDGKSNKIQFIDATWYHKGDRNGRAEFLNGPRLPGATHYFDITDISCSNELFPEENPKKLFAMYPPPTLMGAVLDYMNITPQTTIIIYGREGTLFTPRVWYMFQKYCVPEQKVVSMQGSLEEWIRLGGPVDTTPLKEGVDICTAKQLMTNPPKSKYPVSRKAREQLVDMDRVLNLLKQDESSRP